MNALMQSAFSGPLGAALIRLLNELSESGRQIMLTASGSGEQLDKRLCAEGFSGEAVSAG